MPLMVGVVFAVMVSSVEPVLDPTFSVGAGGTAGASVSTVRLTAADVAVLPARSVDTAVSERTPSGSAEAGVSVQLPRASATTVPIVVVPFFTTTVAPTSAVPLMTGRLLAVELPDAGVVMATAVVVSMMMVSSAEAGETLPATSTATALRPCGPTPRAEEIVTVQLPEPSAMVVPTSVAPS